VRDVGAENKNDTCEIRTHAHKVQPLRRRTMCPVAGDPVNHSGKVPMEDLANGKLYTSFLRSAGSNAYRPVLGLAFSAVLTFKHRLYDTFRSNFRAEPTDDNLFAASMTSFGHINPVSYFEMWTTSDNRNTNLYEHKQILQPYPERVDTFIHWYRIQTRRLRNRLRLLLYYWRFR
jgi:hypothetical protein